jgi:hypothetical protein
MCALSRARQEKCAFHLTKTYMEVGNPSFWREHAMGVIRQVDSEHPNFPSFEPGGRHRVRLGVWTLFSAAVAHYEGKTDCTKPANLAVALH